MKAYMMTDKGKIRNINQDYVYLKKEAIGTLPNLFILADGMGGHNAGEVASEEAVQAFAESVKKSNKKTVSAIFKEAAQNANQIILEKTKDYIEDSGIMGTTIVAATIHENKLSVLNVGDSRLYILNDNLEQVTSDHSYVAEMVRMGEISESEARKHKNRNMITRALGAEENIRPDIFEKELESNEKILMCSDGLYIMLEEDEIADIIQNNKSERSAVKKLIEKANENGGTDNISVILITP